MVASSLSDILKDAKEVAPDPIDPKGRSVTDLPPIARAGVDLAKMVLWFIAIATALLLIMISVEEFGLLSGPTPTAAVLGSISSKSIDPSNATEVENYVKSIESAKTLLSTIEASKQSTRDFLIKIAQLILTSIFLPILTALLGYIFGTQQSNGNGSENDKGAT